jgi:hypothetical protein
MLRESGFFLGGIAVIGLGVLLGVGLALSGAGLYAWSAWLAAGISVGLGAFFLKVGQDARRFRREWLKAVEDGKPPPPGGPPL